MEKTNSVLLEAALKYQGKGYSVIPVIPDRTSEKYKHPFITWKQYQEKRAEPDQIKAWWARWPDANVAIVTGTVSGIGVVDSDSAEGYRSLIELLPEGFITPESQTPKGRHLFVKNTDGLGNATRFIKDCDYRGNGGYIIVPPSIGEGDKQYKWLSGKSIFELPLSELPESIQEQLTTTKQVEKTVDTPDDQLILSVGANFAQHIILPNEDTRIPEGKRDEYLFHIANQLGKARTGKNVIGHVLDLIAQKACNPAFSLNEVREKVKSALKRTDKRDKGLTYELREYLQATSGVFTTKDIYSDLGAADRSVRKQIYKILTRFIDEGFIVKSGDRAGTFRVIEGDLEKMNLKKADMKNVDLWLPFGIQDMVEIMPGNIITVVGDINAGKTALLLNMVYHNLDNFDTHYFSSEMGAQELKKRLLLFDNFPLEHQNFTAYERSENFSDVIKSGEGKLNVIDFLEIYDEFWKIGRLIKDIHDNLKGALAIVAIQKRHPKTEDALGGRRALEKARLTLTMYANRLRITKAKNWRTPDSPNGKEISFSLNAGCQFNSVGGWVRP